MNQCENDIVPFDFRWAINDVEIYYEFGAQTTTWHPKVFEGGLHILYVSHNLHNASCSGV